MGAAGGGIRTLWLWRGGCLTACLASSCSREAGELQVLLENAAERGLWEERFVWTRATRVSGGQAAPPPNTPSRLPRLSVCPAAWCAHPSPSLWFLPPATPAHSGWAGGSLSPLRGCAWAVSCGLVCIRIARTPATAGLPHLSKSGLVRMVQGAQGMLAAPRTASRLSECSPDGPAASLAACS